MLGLLLCVIGAACFCAGCCCGTVLAAAAPPRLLRLVRLFCRRAIVLVVDGPAYAAPGGQRPAVGYHFDE